jgi:hypothetical protein
MSRPRIRVARGIPGPKRVTLPNTPNELDNRLGVTKIIQHFDVAQQVGVKNAQLLADHSGEVHVIAIFITLISSSEFRIYTLWIPSVRFLLRKRQLFEVMLD